MPPIYFDYQSSTPMDADVIQAVKEEMHNVGNPHSDEHDFGWRASGQIEQARAHIAALINCDQDELFFTSGATESNNLAILGTAKGLQKRYSDWSANKRRVLVSEMEHKCVLMSANALTEAHWNVEYIPVNEDGVVDVQALSNILSDDVGLVSVMSVNNEVGTVQPIKEIAALCQRYGIVFHSDAAQAPLATHIDVNAWNVDILSLSSHKMYGPKGIGALYISHSMQSIVEPLLYGGGSGKCDALGHAPYPVVCWLWCRCCKTSNPSLEMAIHHSCTPRSIVVAPSAHNRWRVVEWNDACSTPGQSQYLYPRNRRAIVDRKITAIASDIDGLRLSFRYSIALLCVKCDGFICRNG